MTKVFDSRWRVGASGSMLRVVASDMGRCAPGGPLSPVSNACGRPMALLRQRLANHSGGFMTAKRYGA
jgi:hypothetical protein